jgi:hypothetical protein
VPAPAGKHPSLQSFGRSSKGGDGERLDFSAFGSGMERESSPHDRGGYAMNKWIMRIAAGALGSTLLVPMAGAEEHRKADPHAKAPHPAASPGAAGATETDPPSGAPVVGVGRAHNAVKSSGDEGGTAAGMPGNGPNNER